MLAANNTIYQLQSEFFCSPIVVHLSSPLNVQVWSAKAWSAFVLPRNIELIAIDYLLTCHALHPGGLNVEGADGAH